MKIMDICHQHEINFLTEQINKETLSFGVAYSFGFCIKNEIEEIIAGCNGSVIFGTIYTDQLWVNPKYRKLGLGRKLLDKVHRYGREQGCTMATVNTMNFQGSQGFYEKMGYIVDFERKGYVKNSSCIFLKKDL